MKFGLQPWDMRRLTPFELRGYEQTLTKMANDARSRRG